MAGSSKFDTNAFGPVQLYVAPLTVGAFSCNTLPSQTGLLAEAAGTVGTGVTVICIGDEVTTAGEAHVSDEVKKQVTASPLFRFEVVKVLLFVPKFTPFTFH